jgi:hypothetical protein
MRCGPNKTRLLRCSTCQARFPERKGTPPFDARPPADTLTAVLGHVAEGAGARKTARLTGVRADAARQPASGRPRPCPRRSGTPAGGPAGG